MPWRRNKKNQKKTKLKQKEEIKVKDFGTNVQKVINHDPFDSINERERSALFLKRLRDIRMRYDETTTKIPIIESFYQSGIFIYEMKEINYAYCDPMRVRE